MGETILENGAAPGGVYEWPTLKAAWMHGIKFYGSHIDICRHGQSTLNEQHLVSGGLDAGLSNDGRREAHELATKLTPPYDYCFSSSLTRCRDTLRLVESVMGATLRVEIDARLNERSLGDLQGKPRVYLPELAAGNLDHAPPGGESYRQLAQRTLSFLYDLSERTRGGPARVLICTHMGPMRILRATLGVSHSPMDVTNIRFVNTELLTFNVDNVPFPSFLM